MKISKNLDLKNSKVIFGLFSLLFVVSIVQTSAILKSQNTNQVAKVSAGVDSAASISNTDCVVAGKDNNRIFSNPFDVGEPRDYSFFVGINITNNCARPINIIDPSTFVPRSKLGSAQYLEYSRIERFNGATNSSLTIENPEDSGLSSLLEIVSCMNCPAGSIQYRVSPIGLYPYQNQNTVRTFNLGVGETRRFEFMVEHSVPNNMEFNLWLRVKPIKFSWFYNSAFSDGVVNVDEIKTRNLTPVEQENFATDYTIIVQEGNPFTCSDGQTMTLNDQLEPVCE